MKTRPIDTFINFFWTILCCAPVVWYWYNTGWGIWSYFLLGTSFIAGLLPYRLLQWTRLAKSRRGYERMGVRFIRKLTQNGDWANKVAHTSGNTISNPETAEKYLNTIMMYERFHLICGLFFLLTAIHAFIHSYWITGLLICIANIVFNYAAILLQQYNRLRILQLLQKLPYTK